MYGCKNFNPINKFTQIVTKGTTLEQAMKNLYTKFIKILIFMELDCLKVLEFNLNFYF